VLFLITVGIAHAEPCLAITNAPASSSQPRELARSVRGMTVRLLRMAIGLVFRSLGPLRLPDGLPGCESHSVGYFLRFLCEDGRPLALDEVLAGLQESDPRFQVDGDGTLTRGNERLAQMEINTAADDLFNEEIGELREEAEREGTAASAVMTRLGSVTAILTVMVLWQDRAPEQTLDLLSPLWDWLLANRDGLIYSDGEGFYDGQDLILATR
jgi:hypothetical protein